MSTDVIFELARVRDSLRLAEMSRDMIERGLGWSWNPVRIRKKILSPDNIVLVARAGEKIAGFAIMYVGLEEARLNLLAVSPEHRRKGIARAMVQWLEESALVAGVSVVYLEVRAGAGGAQQFYRQLGYRQVQIMRGYYGGREAALRMGRDLWCGTPNKV